MFKFFKRKNKSEAVQSQSKQETMNAGGTAEENQKVDQDKQDKRLLKRGKELSEITRRRINDGTGYKEPVGDEMDLVPLIYLTTDDYCYMVVKFGFDFPTKDDYDSEETMLAEAYFPINNGFYMHGAFIVQMDLKSREVFIDPKFEAAMKKHLRGTDVIDKLNSFRVKGKPAGWYRIKAENVNKIILAIEVLERTRSN